MQQPGGYPPAGYQQIGYGTQPQGYPPQPGYPAGQYPPGQYPPGQSGQPQGYPPQQGYPAGQYQPPAGHPLGQPAGGYQPQPGPAGATPYPSYQGAPAGAYPGSAPGPAGAAPGGPPAEGYADQPSWQGETANEDADDNPNAPEPQATAPPLAKMDTIAGYNDVSYSDAFLPPPTYEEVTRPQAPEERGQVQAIPVITEEEAREALLQFVAENCCYGKGAAQDLSFRDIQSSSAFHYTLETFAEGRSTAWAYEPFRGQILDTPMNGPAPGAWDIQIAPPQKFVDQVSHVEVPHTASLKPCHGCFGNGRIRCHRCYGRGRIRCSSCHGSGRTTHYEDGHHHHRSCTWCHGSGRRRCYTCHGHGQVKCHTCDAMGQLKCYIKLTIKWLNHVVDHIVERTALPDELIRGVSGKVALEEEFPRVFPINHFPDTAINQASGQLVARHSSEFPLERILMQRQRVRVVPVTEANYSWKDKQDTFFVYGFEHKVYAPNYPQQCCCGCTIL